MIEAFAELQHSFAAAVLGSPVELPIRAATAARAESGLAVHRNNVMSSLIKVLAARFPAVRRLLGEDCFLETVRRFIVAEPPRSPLLLDYGDAFPGFLRSIGEDSCMGHIADVADLEVARGKAYHAADAASLPPQAFAAIPAQRLAGLRLTFHPSVWLLQSRFPIVSLWQANQGAGGATSQQERPEAAVIARPMLEVEVWNLPPGGFAFLTALRCGATMAEATEAAMDAAPDFDLVANLSVLIKAQIVTGLAHSRSPDGAKRNPGLFFAGPAPDCAALHPGY
jgi:Putative DNA-binding domain